MKKIILLFLLIVSVAVTNRLFAENYVNVTLRVDSMNWNVNNTQPHVGLQLLLDPTATQFGNRIPTNNGGFLWPNCDIPLDFFETYFPLRIPANADPVCGTANSVANGNSVTIQIPPGVYDYALVLTAHFNPNATGIRAYFVHDASMVHLAIGNDFVFEIGRKYTFHAFREQVPGTVGLSQLLRLIIEDDAFPNSPGMPQNLAITPDPAGGLSAVISWTNPSVTHGGEALTELTAIHIYQGDDETNPVHVIPNPTIGAVASWTIDVTEAGNHNFKVRGINTAGRGFPARSDTVWIGHDVPASPQDLTFTVTAGNVANLSWTAPTAGLNNGIFTADDLVYDIYLYPFGIRVATGHTSTTFTETIKRSGNIAYKVVARNASGQGGSAISQTVQMCGIYTSLFPWYEGFEHHERNFPPCWTQQHIVGSQLRWSVVPGNFGSPGTTVEGSFKAVFSEAGGGANRGHRTKLILPPFDLSELVVPALSFWHVQRPFMTDLNVLRVFYRTSSTGTWTLLQEYISAVNEWTERTIALPNASATFYIAFEGQFQWGEPIMIDNISVIESPAVTDGEISNLYGVSNPMVGVPFIYRALIENRGGVPLTNYSVQLIDAHHTVLATATGEPIGAFETKFVDLVWTPVSAGTFALRAVLDMPGDEDASNDTSSIVTVNVQANAPTFSGIIGTGTTINAENDLIDIPFNLNWRVSVAQSIYFAHELIGQPASIRQIQYTFQPLTNPLSEEVQIWMTTTDKTQLDDWIPTEDFTLVFDGVVEFSTSGTTTITLPMPYTYTGGNLVIMTHRYSHETRAQNFHITRTPDFPNRSRAHHQVNPINVNDLTMPGRGIEFHPNTVLTFDLSGASISGRITSDGTTPIEGARVEILGTDLYRISDVNGDFAFDFVAVATHQIRVSKFGHFTVTTEREAFTANAYIRNITAEPLPRVTVSGRVIANNFLDGLEGVEVTLVGYADYSAVTGADGRFEIQNVFGTHPYTITASRIGHITYRSTIIFDRDTALNFTMNQIPYAVGRIEATATNDENILVTWHVPGTFTEQNYILDNGVAESGFRSNAYWNHAMGNRFVVPGDRGEIVSVDIFGYEHGQSPINPNKTVIAGIYNAQRQLVATSDPFILPSNDWITVLFDNVPYENTFYVMVKWGATSGNTNHIGYETAGFNAENNHAFFINGTNGNWSPFHSAVGGAEPGVFLIRADANSFEQNDGTLETFDGEFQVFRLRENQPQSEWTLLANNLTEPNFVDNAWNELPSGVYRYAVRARYANNHYSVVRFSNALVNGMEVDFRINLSSTSGRPVTGAIVTLTYETPAYNGRSASHTLISEADGITFPTLWIGRYNLAITLDGHRNYTINNVDVSLTELSHAAVLTEIIRAPFALDVDVDHAQQRAVFSWNNFVPFRDDMENHEDFAIADIGNYTMHFNSEIGTHGLPMIQHPNRFAPHAFQVFNPWATTPPMTNPAMFQQQYVPYPVSGQRVLVSFSPAPNAFSMTRNQWLVLPRIRIYEGVSFSFWTRALVGFPEQIRVMASTTGNQPTDFTTVLSAGAHINVPSTWTQFTYDLSNFAGEYVYLAIHAMSPQGGLVLMIDDIVVDMVYDDNTEGFGGHALSSGNYTIYLNGNVVSTGQTSSQFTFTNLAEGIHTAGVRAVYASGASSISTIQFEVTDATTIQIIEREQMVIYPNPVSDILNIQTDQIIQQIVVFDQSGRVVKTQYGNHLTINLQALPAGQYIVQIRTNLTTVSSIVIKI